MRIIGNDDFDEKIMQPVLAATSLISDTSELFMRSMQMYNMFSHDNRKLSERIPPKSKRTPMAETIEVTNIDGLSEMKIGVLVRSTLTKMLNSHEISEEEIALMQTAEYVAYGADGKFLQLPKLIHPPDHLDSVIKEGWIYHFPRGTCT